MKINVIMAPCLLNESVASDGNQLCILIDVLRATTTITTALDSGAAEIYPCVNIAEVSAYLESNPGVDYLLGGEARGESIPGFDLGNSPFEYMDTAEINGKTILLTTSNGTPLIRKAYEITQQPVYLAAMINLSAVSAITINKALNEREPNVTIICSGRYGNTSLEDTLCAGLIAEKVKEGLLAVGGSVIMSDSAIFAGCFARKHQNLIFDLVSESEAGRFLHDTGFARDVRFCCRTDISRTVPVFVGSRIIASDRA